MIFRINDANPVNMLPGLTRRTLASGQSMMICEFTFEANVEIPIHTHPHEQVGYIISGRVRMTIDGKSSELLPGDSYYAPSNVPHGAFTLEPTVIVDTFNPPREDYRK
jgi:quercetin dioxygenase-like cupin family protein